MLRNWRNAVLEVPAGVSQRSALRRVNVNCGSNSCAAPTGRREREASKAEPSASPIPVPPRQHSHRRNEDPLRLLDPHRPSAPTLTHRPFADRTLETNDMPDTRSRGTAEPAEDIERLADPTPGVQLGFREPQLTG